MNAPGKSFPEMSKDLKQRVYLKLVDWQHWIWWSRPFSWDEPNYLSPEIIITNPDLSSLATNLHKASSHERFDTLVQWWESVAPLSSEELESLWTEVQTLNEQFRKEMETLTQARKSKHSGVRKDKDGHTAEMIDEPSMMEGTSTEAWEVVLEVEGPQKRV